MIVKEKLDMLIINDTSIIYWVDNKFWITDLISNVQLKKSMKIKEFYLKKKKDKQGLDIPTQMDNLLLEVFNKGVLILESSLTISIVVRGQAFAFWIIFCPM